MAVTVHGSHFFGRRPRNFRLGFEFMLAYGRTHTSFLYAPLVGWALAGTVTSGATRLATRAAVSTDVVFPAGLTRNDLDREKIRTDRPAKVVD